MNLNRKQKLEIIKNLDGFQLNFASHVPNMKQPYYGFVRGHWLEITLSLILLSFPLALLGTLPSFLGLLFSALLTVDAIAMVIFAPVSALKLIACVASGAISFDNADLMWARRVKRFFYSLDIAPDKHQDLFSIVLFCTFLGKTDEVFDLMKNDRALSTVQEQLDNLPIDHDLSMSDKDDEIRKQKRQDLIKQKNKVLNNLKDQIWVKYAEPLFDKAWNDICADIQAHPKKYKNALPSWLVKKEVKIEY